MTFSEFSEMFARLYRARHDREPYAITTRRAFNRLKHLSAPTIVVTLTEELA